VAALGLDSGALGLGAALEHDGKGGGGRGRQQEHRDREHLGQRALLVRDDRHGREHEATGDLRNENPEQCQKRKTVEKSGRKAQNDWNNCRGLRST
jgi:hypothetical protein